MKKHLNNFPEHSISIESYNDLLNPCYDSILQFGDRVLVAKMLSLIHISEPTRP